MAFLPHSAGVLSFRLEVIASDAAPVNLSNCLIEKIVSGKSILGSAGKGTTTNEMP